MPISPPEDSVRKPITTIEDAIVAYKTCSAPEGYRQLIDLVIEHGFNLEVQNDSYFDALVLTERMLKQTSSNIKILTGGGCGGFYSTLLPHLTSALERIRAARGQAKMIVLATQYPKWLGVLAQEFSGTFEIALGNSATQLQHFIVCDSKIVRLENVHAALRKDSSAHEIKAEVNFNNPAKGKELENSFDALWVTSVVNRPEESQKTAVPSWLIQRMEALQELPPPTLKDVETSFRSAEAARQKYYPSQSN